ncbi:hypothetical protein H6800_02440 [Candidatus Nomurabacteria bacterium]|nr:hypothetical protein [Candidatus Nomurabacteria bacterium]
MDPNLQPQINQQPPQASQIQEKDGVSTYSIITVVMTVLFPFVGMIMSIIGLVKAKKSQSQVNKIFALVCLGLSLLTQIILIGAVILAFNSPSFKQRKAEQAATKQAADQLYDEVSTRQDVNQQKFDSIENGMTPSQVREVLDSSYVSCDNSNGPSSSGTVTCKWGPGIALYKNIKVTFTNGLVISKSKEGF